MKQFFHDILEDWPSYLFITILGAALGYSLINKPSNKPPPVAETHVVYVTNVVRQYVIYVTNGNPHVTVIGKTNINLGPMSSADIQVLKDIAPEAIDWDSLTPQQKLDTN